jgi:hypothetical protein
VANVGEKMMFDLEIQSTDIPRKPSTFIGEISSRF